MPFGWKRMYNPNSKKIYYLNNKNQQFDNSPLYNKQINFITGEIMPKGWVRLEYEDSNIIELDKHNKDLAKK